MHNYSLNIFLSSKPKVYGINQFCSNILDKTSKPNTSMKGKPMKLYISASELTMNNMLTQEYENGIEKVIYYFSRVMNDAQIR